MSRKVNIAIIKYNAGNIRSVDFALRRMGYDPVITSDHFLLKNADKVIFPGVGEAGTTMKYLREKGLDKLIRELKQPVLGICLGLQLLCSFSEEADTECIGVFNVNVKKFQAKEKVPHMGWNNIHNVSSKIIPDGIDGQYFYFVHSYYAPVCSHTAAITNYINPFSSVLERDNFYATQFHPEKSGITGEELLKTFISI
jgi:imidazole glycerol-phosphate synthase subunit HisH